jgi:hypothetical protein
MNKNYNYTVIKEDNEFKIVVLEAIVQPFSNGDDSYIQSILTNRKDDVSGRYFYGMIRAESFAQAEQFINEDFNYGMTCFGFIFSRNKHAINKITIDLLYLNRNCYSSYVTLDGEDEDFENIYGKIKANTLESAITKINDFFCIDERGE